MRTDKGQFADKRVRQALALTFDRPAAHPAAVQGQGRAGQRPRHLAGLSVLRCHRPAARPGHRQGQAAPVRRRRVRTSRPPSSAASSCEIPDLATLAPEPGRPGRDHPERRPSRAYDTFYDAQWCPADADGSAVLRRRRARHRRLRPPRDPGRLPQLGLQVEGRLERVAVLVPGVRRGVQGIPERRRRRRPEGRLRQDRDDHATRTRRSDLRTSTTTSSGNSKKFTGVYTCALGQMFLSAASVGLDPHDMAWGCPDGRAVPSDTIEPGR